jgi:PAS domain S-box-containing protein
MRLKQYQEAIESSNIVSKTDINGIITFVNDEFCKISGYTKEELIGQNHNIVRHPDVPKEKFEELWDTILAKKTYKATVQNMAKDGSTFYVNTTVVPILDDAGEIEEFIAIRYDVTREVELRLENEQKQKLLFLQSRQASLGQMIANIAHQWKQPLTELNLALFNLKKSFDLNNHDEFMKYYEDSKNVVKNMSLVIDDFMNFFKPERDKKPFLVSEAIEDALMIVGKVLKEEKIKVVKKIDDIELIGISNELSQVLINIIQNAKDAFKQNSIRKRVLKITTIVKDDKFLLEISDNAGGIYPEVLEKIFEPYFTTKHSSVGTGLGLFVASMIIEQTFDGVMSVENSENGAKFTISIPLKNHPKGCKCCV